MKKQTLSFQYDIFFIVKQLLYIYIEKTLHYFDIKEISHINSINKYNIPKFISATVYDYINNLTNDEIEIIMKSLHDENNDTFLVDKHIPEIFEALTQTDKFKKQLNDFAIRSKPIDNYVIDKTTNTMYKASFGEHLATIYEIIKLHPELDTIQKQDDFIINKLELGGNKMDKPWYQPKEVIHNNVFTMKDKLLKYDSYAIFKQIYNDILEANKSRPNNPKTDLSIYIDCYEKEKVLHITSHGTKQIISFLTDCDLQEDLNNWKNILGNPIIDKYNHEKNYKKPIYHDCEIINIYRQNTYKEDLPELKIYQKIKTT